MKTLSVSHYDVRSAFEHETRDPEFANERERLLIEVVAASFLRLVPEATFGGVECRQYTCVANVSVASEFGQYAVQLYPWGEAVEPAIDADGNVQLLIVTSPQQRDIFASNVAQMVSDLEPRIRESREAWEASHPPAD